jgi:site-specific DNA-methyltransferase (adenine-specific)
MTRIYTGDVLEVLPRLVPKESVDCLIVDPPYGETSLEWDRRVPGWPSEVRRILKPTGSMWVFGSARMFLETAAEFEGWRLAQDVVWEKHNGAGFFADRFRRVHEFAWQFYRSDAQWADVYKAPQFTNDAAPRTVRRKGRPAHWTGERGDSVYRSEDGGPRLQRSVLYVRSEHGSAEHPTQKPLAIVEPLLLYSCPQGGHVLDPFAGSGTVGILAKRHGMTCTLIEANLKYRTLIERRLQDDAPLLAEVGT